MTAGPQAPTFRDPAGSLTLEEHHATRTIHPSARSSVLAFLASPFCRRLQQRGDLIAATIDDTPSGLRLFHPRIPIPTYPWEWTPLQWLSAAELTLTLCEEALAEGWSLKDATPLNILFVGSRPILVDILSFEPRDPASAVWLAYAQYIRTFLLPLLALQKLGWPLALTLFRRDGYEPAELFASMGWLRRFSRDIFWPITLPVWLEKFQSSSEPGIPTPPKTDPDKAIHILQSRFSDLRRRTARTVPRHLSSAWSTYPDTLTHYTPAQTSRKNDWLHQTLADLRPHRILDIGANTGEYSILAATLGIEVIALERDAAAAERLFSIAQTSHLSIQTIHADLARPTPAVGWDNRESPDLLTRLQNACDLVMMLAVIHHLLLTDQIPLPAILDLCARLTRRYLILEWVPPEDPMYQTLMRGRETLYGSLTETDLLHAAKPHFTQRQRETLGNGRILFLFEKL